VIREGARAFVGGQLDANPSSSLKRRSVDFGANFFGEVIHSHYVQIKKAM